MGITAVMALLKLALLCIDFLAWPAIALGYPLFASIMAVESGSKHHMKKLVMYWVIFSLFSLFEFAFAKVIEWIPFWACARLVVFFWLVIPEFGGACYAYQGIVSPVLLVKVRAVIDWFYRLKEERVCKRETFLEAVEKYIEENGPEIMTKLIELELHEPSAARRDTKMLEATAMSAATKTKKVPYAQSTSSMNQRDTTTNVDEMTQPETSADNKLPETPPLVKTQQEWSCILCNITAMNELTLNAHLQGTKHRSKLESMKVSMLGAQDAGQSPSHIQPISADRYLKGTNAAVEVKGIMSPKEAAEKRRPETNTYKKAKQKWTLKETESKMALKADPWGLKAQEHGAKDTGPSQLALCELNHGNVANKFLKEGGSVLEAPNSNKVHFAAPIKTGWVPKVTDEDSETIPPETSVENISKHKFESLKSSKLPSMDSGLSPSAMCNAASIKNVWVPKVTKEDSEMTPPETSAENRSKPKVESLKTSKRPSVESRLSLSAMCNAASIKTVWVPRVTEEDSEMTPQETSAENRSKPKFESGKTSNLPSMESGLTPSAMCNAESIKTVWVPKITDEDSKMTTPETIAENRNKPKFESLKTSELPSMESGLSPSAMCNEAVMENIDPEESVMTSLKAQRFKHRCVLCNVKLISDVDLASHLLGRRHSSNVLLLRG